jgi:hypothetical protein
MSVSEVRLAPPLADLEASLGLLKNLPAIWTGKGFNLIWRPNFEPIGGVSSDHFLELNLTHEITKFEFIGAPIPNRGLAQGDITLFGVHYLQQISDAITHGALHLEPGIWINIPTTTEPAAPLENAVARLSTIPHGNALVAQGQAIATTAAPVFDPVNVNPFPIGGGAPIPFPELDLATPSGFRSPLPHPAAIDPVKFQAVVNNPNILLTDAIAEQTILNTTVVRIATDASIPVTDTAPVTMPNGEGGIENIAFLESLTGTPPPTGPPHTLPNANTADMFATFWIEEVENPFGAGSFFQLQYSQTVYLNFAGLTWPHVSVATLVSSSVVGP